MKLCELCNREPKATPNAILCVPCRDRQPRPMPLTMPPSINNLFPNDKHLKQAKLDNICRIAAEFCKVESLNIGIGIKTTNSPKITAVMAIDIYTEIEKRLKDGDDD